MFFVFVFKFWVVVMFFSIKFLHRFEFLSGFDINLSAELDRILKPLEAVEFYGEFLSSLFFPLFP